MNRLTLQFHVSRIMAQIVYNEKIVAEHPIAQGGCMHLLDELFLLCVPIEEQSVLWVGINCFV